MTRPTLKERQRKLREDAILESTMRLLAMKGFDAMTMDDVANDVGISKATLYQHFKSKEELAVRVVLNTIIHMEARIQAIDPGLPALARLQEMVRLIIAKRFGNPILDFSDAEATIKPLLRRNEEFLIHEKVITDSLSNVIEAAKAEGHIMSNLSTPILVRAFLGCMQDGSYFTMLREGKCTLADLETTLMGMITSDSHS